jgi:DNA-binding response OmpR family regulator
MSSNDIKTALRNEVFDALIINGKMPGGWGAQEIYEWVKQSYGGLEKKLLFTFSSVADPETRKFLQENNVPMLVKPFEVADLINHARRLLQKTQAASAS